MRCENAPHIPPGIILVVGDLATTASGPNAVVRRFAAWLVSQGHDVTVVGTWRGQRPSLAQLRDLHGHARIVVHRRYFKDSWHFAPGIMGFVAQLLFFKKPHVIDVHSVWLFNGIVLSLVAKVKRWRSFMTLHGNLRPVAFNKSRTWKILAMRLFFRWLLRSASGLIALNEQEKSEALEILSDASLSIIGNGVTPHPSALTCRRPKEVLFLGRIHPIKNLESLIDAFSLIGDEFPNWRLSIIGPSADPRYLEELKSRCTSLNLGERIAFFDAVYDEEKEIRFLSASLFALTSWSEGQPFAVLEAMAHGLPVLLSDQCNIAVPETCGRVCGCSSEDIAQALREMLMMTDDQLRHMRSEAVNFVSREFCEDSVFNKRLLLYFV